MNKNNTKKLKKRMIENQKIFLKSRSTVVYFDQGEPLMIYNSKPKKFLNIGAKVNIKNFIRGCIKGQVIKMKRIKIGSCEKVWGIYIHVTSIDREDCLTLKGEK